MRRLLAVCLTVLAAACTRDTSPLAVVPTQPAASELIAGLGQTGRVGEPLANSLVVRVTDRFGNPVAGVPVSWSVASGSGTLSPASTTTDARGESKAAWTLGTVAGANAAVATIEGLGTIRFEATAVAGPPAQLIKVSGDGQTATVGTALPEPLVVRVADRFGNPVSGATVTWLAGGGGVNPTSSTSNEAGEATTRWALGTAAGPTTATASVAGVAQAVFLATGLAGPPTTVVKVAGDNQTATVGSAAPDSLVVRVTDQYGNSVNGVTVTWTVTAGGGSVSPATAVTGADGLARARWTLGNTAGTNTATATVAGIAGLPSAVFTATGRAGPPANITRIRGDGQTGTIGAALADSLVVRVTDSFGNPVSGATVSWTVTAGGGSVSPASTVTNATGEARTRWTLGSTPGPQTVSAAVGALPPVVFNATASTALGPNLTIAAITITQATQTLNGTVPLVSLKSAYLRVFVTADRPNTVAPTVRVRFYSGATVVATQTIFPPSTSVPLTVNEAQGSWNVVVSGAVFQPGIAILVDVDPEQAVPEPNEGDNAYPSSGAPATLDVRTPPTFAPLLVPVRQSANGLEGRVTAANRETFLTFGRKVLPITTFSADVRAVYTTSGPALTANDETSAWTRILSELSALRTAEGSTRPYYGVVRVAYTNGVAGLGYIGFPVAMGWDQNSADEIAAHEWGHNFNRLHTPGCGAGNLDPAYPYAQGRIGVYGIDPETGMLYSPASHYDFMGYCSPAWTSDYTYRAILNYRAANPMQGFVVGREEPSLLIWGRIGPDGLELEPAFQVTTRPVLPEAPGPYTLAGLDAAGNAVFSFSFNPVEVADEAADGAQRHFAFAVPLSQASPERLSRLRLSGPGMAPVERGGDAAAAAPPAAFPAPEARRVAPADVEIRWEVATSPVVMVRDPATGVILSFARGGVMTLTTTANDLELVLSDGVRSSVRRVPVR